MPGTNTLACLRSFSAEVETLSAEWRAEVVSSLSWEASEARARPGEAEGFFVRCGERGGYAKPGKNKPPVGDHPRAAHEKIASDLAFELGLPVPPCVLWERPNPGQGQERFVAVSAVPFTPVLPWAEAKRTDAGRRALRAMARAPSAMAVFDTWVGNTDRHNDGNVLLQEDDRRAPPVARIAYIDYANALSYGWPEGKWATAGVVLPYPGPPDVVVDIDAMSEVISMVTGFRRATIEEIVGRIPGQFLSDPKREIILKGLLHRQEQIRGTMRAAYGEIP